MDYRPPGSSVEFFRQEYWCGLPFPFPGDLRHPGIKPRSPAMQADSLLSGPLGKPRQHSGGAQRPPSEAGTLPLEQDVAQNFRTGDGPEAVREWHGWEMNQCQSKRRWGCIQARDLLLVGISICGRMRCREGLSDTSKHLACLLRLDYPAISFVEIFLTKLCLFLVVGILSPQLTKHGTLHWTQVSYHYCMNPLNASMVTYSSLYLQVFALGLIHNKCSKISAPLDR